MKEQNLSDESIIIKLVILGMLGKQKPILIIKLILAIISFS